MQLLLSRVFDWLSLKVFVWLSLATQIGIVVTGGLVRLTGSGLGCPTWPKCTADSLVTVPAQGLHGVIEFGNRLLTFLLLVVAVLTFILVWRSATRKLLLWPAIWLGLGIPAQAVLGGFTVWSQLNPWFVGAHFILSGIMIVIASLLVWRFYSPAAETIPSRVYQTAPLVAFLGLVTVVVGVLVTGAGPHAGDDKSVRNGLDLEQWQHYHSWPAYALLALIVIQYFGLRRAGAALALRVSGYLVILISVQALVGVAQARLGVPVCLVLIHMLLASCLVSLLSFNYFATRIK